MIDVAHPPHADGAPARRLSLTLRTGRAVHPVLRMWDGGLSLPAEAGADLRGRVDVYDGRRHLFHALIVASDDGGVAGEVRCSFKRVTPADATPARDYCTQAGLGDDVIG